MKMGLGLAAETEALDELMVFFLATGFDVVEQLAAAGDEFEKSAARREILGVEIQVVGEVEDALGEQGDLVWRAAGVSFVKLIFLGVDGGAHGGMGWVQQVAAGPS